MYDVAAGVLLDLMALTAIGVGPAFLLLQAERHFATALASAPAIGFAITSILGSYLVVFDKPVSYWAVPWLFSGSMISLIVCIILALRRKSEHVSVDLRLLAIFGAGLLLTIVLLTAPMIAGGLTFTNLRGNGADGLNYMIVAGYLDHEPLSWAWRVDTQALIDRNPSYVIARQVLAYRWTTSAMLAWAAEIAHVPLYRFAYGFSLLSLVLAFGPVFLCGVSAGVGRVHALLLAIAVCVGFWAQFVTDIRALSQINSIPLIVLLALLFGRIEGKASIGAWGERVLLGISGGALILLYVEIVPLVVLGLGIFAGTRARNVVALFSQIGRHWISGLVAAMGALPLTPTLARMLIGQITFAATGHITWDKAYFSWLYANPLTGLWGLAYLAIDPRQGGPVAAGVSQAALTILGVLLSAILAWALISVALTGGGTGVVSVSASFALAGIIQCLFLVLRGQLWAAGKSLSFAYPFIMMSTVALTTFERRLSPSRWGRVSSNTIRGGVAIWLATQCALGFYRISYATKGIDYPRYITHHAEYRRHPWDWDRLMAVLQTSQRKTLGLLVSNEALAEYLVLALGWDSQVVKVDGVRDRSGRLVGFQDAAHMPDYWIVEKGIDVRKGEMKPVILAESRELVLIQVSVDSSHCDLAFALQKPGSVQAAQTTNTSFWLGDEPTYLRFVSPVHGEAVLTARFSARPTLAEQPGWGLTIRSSAREQVRVVRVTGVTQEVRVPVRKGVNELELRVSDRRSALVSPNGGGPSLLLGVQGLAVRCARLDDRRGL